ncbi:MAG: DUF4097 family beta strand repeat protein [Oscillospiraceae bacterium]|nr:DUF4097 family beta strand repeat protein [Oscillospiraceae bacterium]
MTTFQKVIKYAAFAFAIFLTVSIISGILGAVGVVGGLFKNDAVLDDMQTYTVSEQITSLKVNINAADFTVKQADSFSVESNLKNLSVEDDNGVLTIRETKKLSGSYSNAALILYIPKELVFERADIITGAGRLTVDALSADILNLELGAGEVRIDSLIAVRKADIDGGAGKITIAGGSLNNLELDMGVGQLNLTSAVHGNSEFDLGIGESNIVLIGSKDDYEIEAEKGIGNITVDGKTVSDGGIIGNGANKIEIGGAIGEINLSFKEQ